MFLLTVLQPRGKKQKIALMEVILRISNLISLIRRSLVGELYVNVQIRVLESKDVITHRKQKKKA